MTTDTKILDEIVEFSVYSWATTLYIITSERGHYLWKDGTIHRDACEPDPDGKKYKSLLDNPNWGYWPSEDEAKEFLKKWRLHNQLRRIETIEKLV